MAIDVVSASQPFGEALGPPNSAGPLSEPRLPRWAEARLQGVPPWSDLIDQGLAPSVGDTEVRVDAISNTDSAGSSGRAVAANVLAGGAVALTFPGVSEATRGAVLFGSLNVAANMLPPQYQTLAAAATTTAYTYATERAAGGWGMPRLLETKAGHAFVQATRKMLGKVGLLKENVQTGIPVDAAVAFSTGVAAMTVVKQEGDPTRTREQNSKYGKRMAAAISVASAPVAYAVAEGVHEITPERVGVAALALAGLAVAVSKAKGFARRRIAEAAEAAGDEVALNEVVAPRYDLTKEELGRIEERMVRQVRVTHGRSLAAVWVRGDSHEANFLRTHEDRSLPDVNTASLFEPYEGSSSFLAIVDTRRGSGKGRVIRGTRLTGGQFAPGETKSLPGGMNMASLRDMVLDGETSAAELEWYYSWKGIDLPQCVGIETNFRIGERARRYLGVIPISHLAYLAMYNYLVRNDPDSERFAMFAHINTATADSLRHMGVDVEPIAGREDLKTPAGPNSRERYDEKFKPVAMLNTRRTRRTMHRLQRFAPKQLHLRD